MQNPVRPAVRLLSILVLAACSSATRYSGMAGNVLVVWEPGREGDAMMAAARAGDLGWTVDVAPAGPATRSRSSLAIYGQRHKPGRGADLADAVRPAVGDVDVLPFLADGPGGRNAVLWLAR
jgi:hypothetical protein